jgi:hypothetical protein
MVAFTGAREWLEMTIDHPVRRLSCTVVFPKLRPCHEAALLFANGDEAQITLPIVTLPDGRSLVRVELPLPHSHVPYTINWSW